MNNSTIFLHFKSLDHKSLNLVLQGSDLVHEITGVVGGDAGSNDGTRNTAGSSEGTIVRVSMEIILWRKLEYSHVRVEVLRGSRAGRLTFSMARRHMRRWRIKVSI